jgi:hypothetical protein
MTDHKDRPPAFELQAAARAREITFHKVGDVTWRTENAGHVERTVQRDGLPSPIPPHTRYTDIHISTHIKAWLNETGEPGRQPRPGPEC